MYRQSDPVVPDAQHEAESTSSDEQLISSLSSLGVGHRSTSETLQPSEASFIHRRSSEFHPSDRYHPASGTNTALGHQARRDRRLSDPGRLAVPLLRLSQHHQTVFEAAGETPPNGSVSPQSGARLSDPRLAAIRSLFSGGPCEVGEALASPATGSRSPRSRSPTSPSDMLAQQHQLQYHQRVARHDTRRLSLPNPQPISSLVGATGRSSLAAWLLPTEVNEAMGAVSGFPSTVASGVPFQMSSSPPMTRTTVGLAAASSSPASNSSGSAFDGDHLSSSMASNSLLQSGSFAFLQSSTSAQQQQQQRRRRSVSLDQSGGVAMRLEAISEENPGAGGGSKITTAVSISKAPRKSLAPLATVLSYE